MTKAHFETTIKPLMYERARGSYNKRIQGTMSPTFQFLTMEQQCALVLDEFVKYINWDYETESLVPSAGEEVGG